MSYRVLWQDEALDDLLEIDKQDAKKLVNKVESYLARSPHDLGKRLSGQFTGLYRYRFGKYRVIYEIIEQELHIYIVKVGHRKSVYDVD